MKLAFLVVLITCLNVSAKVFSQEKISLDVKNAKLQKVLKTIEKQSKYRFVYSPTYVPVDKSVTITANDALISEVLESILDNTGLGYSVSNNGLVLILRKGIVVKDILISGTVKDASGRGLPGVSVTVKGLSGKGVSTDAQGKFSLSAPQNSVIVFSLIGYEPQEIQASKEGVFNVVLKESNSQLNEVVVVGYGTQKKVNLTGAVATISSEKLDSRPITNIGQGLQGLVPNLVVNTGNGAPGKGASFNIRGTSTISGTSSTAPLVLVDGVVMDPNLINPQDVATVSVLKDASSAAIYGARGANGVILITTKTPQKNSPMRLNFSSNYTNSRPTIMAKYLNSVDYVRMHREADRTGRNGGTTASFPFTDKDSIMINNYFNDPANNPSVYVDPAYSSTQYKYVGNTDWNKELYKGWAGVSENNLSLSGGQGKITYVASLGYLDQNGLLKAANQVYNRYNGTLKLNAEATSWLDLNFKFSLNKTDLNTVGKTAINSATDFGFISGDLRPNMPIYHPDGNFAGQGSWTNQFAIMAQNGRYKQYVNDLWLTGGFVIKPIANLRIVGDLTWNGYNYNDNNQQKAFNEYGAKGLLGAYPWTTPSRFDKSSSNDNYYAINTYAEYEKTFSGLHYLKAMIGYNQELKQVNSFSAGAKNLITDNLESMVPNSDPKPTVGQSGTAWAVSGTFVRLNYIFNNKYLLEVNGRYDGTSRFASGKRYIFSPSASAGWRISEENFFKPLKKVIDNLKFRGSYGTMGNQALNSNYPYIASMGIGTTGYIFDTAQGNYVTNPGLVSADFTWEKITTLDLGVDAELFKNQLNVTFDWFKRKTTGMLVGGFPLPSVLGTNVPTRNAADLQAKGFELSVDWHSKIGEKFRYNIGVSLSDYQNTITKYDLNPTGSIGDYYVGRKIGEIWGFTTAGFFQSDAEAARANQTALGGDKLLAGDIKYVDKDGNGKIDYGKSTLSDPGDRSIIGNSTPRYQFGLNLGASYKNFDFTIFAQGVLKKDAALGGNYFWGFTDEWSVPTQLSSDYWTPTNTNAYFPRVRFGSGNNYQTQTKYLQNAAYARIKQITIGYTVPASLIKRISLTRLRIYATGQNLFTFTSLNKNFDPELLDARGYPINKSISFGIQLGL